MRALFKETTYDRTKGRVFMKLVKQADFFLGANTPNGFASFFSELNDPAFTDHCYIIKGCPGSGKSTMMKKAADNTAWKERLTERIHCSSDPDSLDGVILHDTKTIIADGTPPHPIEPVLPIAYETVVSLYGCFDRQKVADRRKEAMELNKKIKDCHKRCCCYLAGAELLLHDNFLIASQCTDYLKIAKLVQRLVQKEIPDKKSVRGTEHKRLLNAFTPKGNIVYTDTVSALCSKVYVIKDEYSASSRALLDGLKQAALSRGYDLFFCYSPLGWTDQPEHLLIPELELGFFTENSYISYPEKPYRVIHHSRFTDKERLRLKKQRLSFNKRAAREILNEAVGSVAAAKALHDDLESIYGSGVDFAKVNKMCVQMLSEIMARYH